MQFIFKYTWGIWRQSQRLLSNKRKKVEALKLSGGEQGKFLAGEWVDPAINREYFLAPGRTVMAGFVLLKINKTKQKKDKKTLQDQDLKAWKSTETHIQFAC